MADNVNELGDNQDESEVGLDLNEQSNDSVDTFNYLCPPHLF